MKNKKIFSQFRKGKLDDFSGLINRAYKFAAYAHKNQKRKSGHDYMTHPVSIMNYLRSMDVDENILIAALLHDVIEDTSISLEDIRELFNSEIAYMVYFLSKDSSNYFKNNDYRRAVYFNKLEAGFCFNYGIYLIKLVDRLHNISTMEALNTQRQQKTVKETLTIFIPLFKKYFKVVPKKLSHYCEEIINHMEEIMKDYMSD